MKKNLVEQILSEYPRARYDDKFLQLKVWELQGLTLDLKQMGIFLGKGISAPESIRRTRQKLQECGKYLPVKEVQQARKDKADSFRQTVVKAEPLSLFRDLS